LYLAKRKTEILPGNYICISFKNLIEHESAITRCEEEGIGLGITLCTKIAESYDGNLEYSENSGAVTAKLSLPFIQNDPSTMLASASAFSELKESLEERYKPVRLFMQEVLARYDYNSKPAKRKGLR
jgi:hypothetical protein